MSPVPVKFEKCCLEVKGGPGQRTEGSCMFLVVGNDIKNKLAQNPENSKYVIQEVLRTIGWRGGTLLKDWV